MSEMTDLDSLRDEALRLVLDMGYGPSSTIAERANDIRRRWDKAAAAIDVRLHDSASPARTQIIADTMASVLGESLADVAQASEFLKLSGQCYAWVKLLATGERSPSDLLFLDLYVRMLELERGPAPEPGVVTEEAWRA